jgi:parallel beta-helix repeat protein
MATTGMEEECMMNLDKRVFNVGFVAMVIVGCAQHDSVDTTEPTVDDVVQEVLPRGEPPAGIIAERVDLGSISQDPRIVGRDAGGQGKSIGAFGDTFTTVGDHTSLASATDCEPTRGAIGPRATSYTPPGTNVRYVSRLRGSPPPAPPNQCVWGGAGNPFSTVREAINCASRTTATTIVVEAGEYEEGELQVTADKRIILQRKGTDAVTFSGSRVIQPQEWTSVANPPAPLRPHWTKTIAAGDRTYTVPSQPWSPDSECKNVNPPCWSHLVDPPEQVFIDGQALIQVRTLAEVDVNKFFYNSQNRTYHVGSNPNNNEVRISYRSYALELKSPGSAVLGITFKQYGGTIPGSHAAVFGKASDQLFEDNVFTQNNAAGLSVYADSCGSTSNVTIRNNELSYNGQMGLHVSCTNQTKVLNNYTHSNRWLSGWQIAAHGGMKADRALNMIVKNNDAFDNLGQGLWLDISSNDAKIIGNRAIGNSGIGILFEISQRAMIVNNRMALNKEAGIWIANSTDARIFNNAFADNGNGKDPSPMRDDINDANIAVIGDFSRLGEPAPHTRNITIKNNVSSMHDGRQWNVHIYAHAIGYIPGVNATGDNPPDGNDLNDFNVITDFNAFWRYAPQEQPFTADPLFHWDFRTPTGTTHKEFFSIVDVRMPHSDKPGQERPGQELHTPLPLLDRAGPVDPFLAPWSLDSKGGALLDAGVDLDDDMVAQAEVVKACGKNVGPFTFH